MTEGYGFYNLMTFIKIESMKAIFGVLPVNRTIKNIKIFFTAHPVGWAVFPMQPCNVRGIHKVS